MADPAAFNEDKEMFAQYQIVVDVKGEINFGLGSPARSLWYTFKENEDLLRKYNSREECLDIANKYRETYLDFLFKVEKCYDECSVYRAYDREAKRFRSKEYVALPTWFPMESAHFVHASVIPQKKYEGWVAYTPNKDYLLADRQVSLPASKYIAKFFKDQFRPEEIAKMQSRLIAEFSNTKFAITQDIDILRAAYKTPKLAAESSSYTSCMAYASANFNLWEPMHPADAYFFDDPAQSDFSLAYIYREVIDTGEFQIVARAMILHKTKKFVRVYGSSEFVKDELIRQLQELGYERAKSFVGARLCLRVHPDESSPAYIVPYLDGLDKWITSNGTICSRANDDAAFNCETTEGLVYLESERCASDDDDDDDEDYINYNTDDGDMDEAA